VDDERHDLGPHGALVATEESIFARRRWCTLRATELAADERGAVVRVHPLDRALAEERRCVVEAEVAHERGVHVHEATFARDERGLGRALDQLAKTSLGPLQRRL